MSSKFQDQEKLIITLLIPSQDPDSFKTDASVPRDSMQERRGSSLLKSELVPGMIKSAFQNEGLTYNARKNFK